MVKSKIKDIFKGEYIDIWEDGEFITIAFPFVTYAMNKEEWEAFKKDIDKIAEL